MRKSLLVSLAAVLLLLPTVARAQYGGYGGRGGYGRERRPTHADSTRTLSGKWQLWGHVGPGWLESPAEVRQRYKAGLDFGMSGDRRFADRVALRAHLDYLDLPSTQPNLVLINGLTYANVNPDYGHGWRLAGVIDFAVRPWNHLWLEGGGGGAYFNSGFSGSTIQDLNTGNDVTISAPSGWGGIWNAGLRYEFKPTVRDRLFAEYQFSDMMRSGTRVSFMAIRVGYRAF